MVSKLPKYLSKLACMVIFIHTQAHTLLHLLLFCISSYNNAISSYNKWKKKGCKFSFVIPLPEVGKYPSFSGEKMFNFLSPDTVTWLQCSFLQSLKGAWSGNRRKGAGRRAEAQLPNPNWSSLLCQRYSHWQWRLYMKLNLGMGTSRSGWKEKRRV